MEKLLILSLPQLQTYDIANNIHKVLSQMCDTIYMCVHELKLSFSSSRFMQADKQVCHLDLSVFWVSFYFLYFFVLFIGKVVRISINVLLIVESDLALVTNGWNKFTIRHSLNKMGEGTACKVLKTFC